MNIPLRCPSSDALEQLRLLIDDPSQAVSRCNGYALVARRSIPIVDLHRPRSSSTPWKAGSEASPRVPYVELDSYQPLHGDCQNIQP